jgi:putative IMPACT (imprinted ancient) family translation regulator
LLGVPGLINAYKSASLIALEDADVITRYVREVYLFRFTFEKMNEIMRVVKENELKVLSQTYDDLCGLEVEIRQSMVSKVLARIEDIREIEAGYLRTI